MKTNRLILQEMLKVIEEEMEKGEK